MNMNIVELKDKILNGYQLKKNNLDDVKIIEHSDLDLLLSCANEIRKEFQGEIGSLCTIINGKGGRCSENCKFCAQSSYSKTDVKSYPFLDEESLLSEFNKVAKSQINRFSIVTAGRKLEGDEFETACLAFSKINKKTKINLCASFGLLDYNDFLELKKSGVNRIHANIETSKEFFPQICTSHSFEDKINCIKAAKNAGMQVCSGGIIGLGESFQDRVSMAFTLNELNVDSIPINVLIPIEGTAFEKMEPLTKEDVLRTIALFRFINPNKEIRFAAGRTIFEDKGAKAFNGGANAAITGDMLTTTGTGISDDISLFNRLGYELEGAKN